MFRIILINLGFLVIAAVCSGIFFGIAYLFSFTSIPNTSLLQMGIFLVTALIIFGLFMVYMGAAGCVTKELVDYEGSGFKDFFRYLKQTWLTSLLFSSINVVIFALVAIACQYYFNVFKNIIGLFLIFFIIGIYFYWFTASFYFLPLQAKFGPALKKNIKKSFILFFDNTAFSLFGLLLVSLAIWIFSFLPPVLLLLGPASVLLWGNVALKLRLLKYDYLEEHPDANRKKIPWDILLAKEKEKVGKRTLRGLIFPWKE